MFRVPHDQSLYIAASNTEKGIEQRNHSVNGIVKSLVVLACLGVSACSVSNTLDQTNTQDTIVTSSVSKPVKTEGINSTDAELIKSVVADSSQIESLAWQNPDTGNKGTITAIDAFVGSHGQQCKKFQTTVDTFMGISLYNGETCELRKGFWVLSWFLRQDG